MMLNYYEMSGALPYTITVRSIPRDEPQKSKRFPMFPLLGDRGGAAESRDEMNYLQERVMEMEPTHDGRGSQQPV